MRRRQGWWVRPAAAVVAWVLWMTQAVPVGAAAEYLRPNPTRTSPAVEALRSDPAWIAGEAGQTWLKERIAAVRTATEQLATTPQEKTYRFALGRFFDDRRIPPEVIQALSFELTDTRPSGFRLALENNESTLQVTVSYRGVRDNPALDRLVIDTVTRAVSTASPATTASSVDQATDAVWEFQGKLPPLSHALANAQSNLSTIPRLDQALAYVGKLLNSDSHQLRAAIDRLFTRPENNDLDFLIVKAGELGGNQMGRYYDGEHAIIAIDETFYRSTIGADEPRPGAIRVFLERFLHELRHSNKQSHELEYDAEVEEETTVLREVDWVLYGLFNGPNKDEELEAFLDAIPAEQKPLVSAKRRFAYFAWLSRFLDSPRGNTLEEVQRSLIEGAVAQLRGEEPPAVAGPSRTLTHGEYEQLLREGLRVYAREVVSGSQRFGHTFDPPLLDPKVGEILRQATAQWVTLNNGYEKVQLLRRTASRIAQLVNEFNGDQAAHFTDYLHYVRERMPRDVPRGNRRPNNRRRSNGTTPKLFLTIADSPLRPASDLHEAMDQRAGEQVTAAFAAQRVLTFGPQELPIAQQPVSLADAQAVEAATRGAQIGYDLLTEAVSALRDRRTVLLLHADPWVDQRYQANVLAMSGRRSDQHFEDPASPPLLPSHYIPLALIEQAMFRLGPTRGRQFLFALGRHETNILNLVIANPEWNAEALLSHLDEDPEDVEDRQILNKGFAAILAASTAQPSERPLGQFLQQMASGQLAWNGTAWVSHPTDEKRSLEFSEERWKAESARKYQAIFTEAQQGIAQYLDDEKAHQRMDEATYKKASANVYPNLVQWLLDSYKTPNTKKGLVRSIKRKDWKALVTAFFDDATFGTAGVRNEAAVDQADFLALVEDGIDPQIFRSGDEVAALLNTPGAIEQEANEVLAVETDDPRYFLKGPYTINDENVFKTYTQVVCEAINYVATAEGRQGKLVVSYDSRAQGAYFANIIAAVAAANHVEVILADQALPMPILSFAVRYFHADAAILISASHNKKRYNGFKLLNNVGAQLDQASRQRIVDRLFGNPKAGVARIRSSEIHIAPLERSLEHVTYMGGEVPVPGFEYHGRPMVNITAPHRDSVRQRLARPDILQQIGPRLRIGYCPFYGAGKDVIPPLLASLGIPQESLLIPREFNRLDPTMPAFDHTASQLPDPGDPEAWKGVFQRTVQQLVSEGKFELEALQEIVGRLWIGTDPDADRGGFGITVDQSAIPDDPEARRLMGVVTLEEILQRPLKDEERRHFGAIGGMRILPANDAWTLLLDYDLAALEEQRGQAFDGTKVVTVKSHVTTSGLNAVAEKYGTRVEETYVGFTLLAVKAQELKQQGHDVVMMAEESNGYSTGDHTYEKDGTLAAVRMLEILAYATSQGKTFEDFLTERIYTDGSVGLFATGNLPLEFKGVTGLAKRTQIMRWIQTEFAPDPQRRIDEGTPLRVGDFVVTGVKVYQTGKYDQQMYEGAADEGVRIFLTSSDGMRKVQVTIRPSGTEPKLRFYTELRVPGLTKATLPDAMRRAYEELSRLTQQFQAIAERQREIEAAAKGLQTETQAAAPTQTEPTLREALQSLPYPERLRALGVTVEKPEDLVSLRQAFWAPAFEQAVSWTISPDVGATAADVSSPRWVVIHSSAFVNAPDAALAYRRVRDQLQQVLGSGPRAIRFALVVDGAASPDEAEKIVGRFLNALPSASSATVNLSREDFDAIVPGQMPAQRLAALLEGPSGVVNPMIAGLVGPRDWAQALRQACQTPSQVAIASARDGDGVISGWGQALLAGIESAAAGGRLPPSLVGRLKVAIDEADGRFSIEAEPLAVDAMEPEVRHAVLAYQELAGSK